VAPPDIIAPRWQILSGEAPVGHDTLAIRISPGPGFGDGGHPTTRLCLQALAALAPRGRPFRLLDFGSGSGILTIAAAAHLGATVEAVEIDPRATEHAAHNFRTNQVVDRVRQITSLSAACGPFDVIVANILRAVLVAHAEPLTRLLASPGTLVLSGLVSTDLPEVITRYTPLMNDARPEVYERDEWRGLVWRARTESDR
jgi:ribosomal protein L11 methyltransferase